MIDIHNHLLPGVDDGSRSFDESIEVLKNLESVGYKSVILTPHYIRESRYSSNKENNLKVLNKLKEEIKKNNININLYLGNEIFYDKNIIDLLNNNEISSLNNSKYLLIELPMSGDVTGYEEVFSSLIRKGYKVILAHPERYFSFQKDYKKINNLVDIGVLLQCNIESIMGGYGSSAKKTVKKIFKDKKVSLLGTDIHHKKDNYEIYLKAKKKICKYISEEEYNNLVNPSYLIS